MLPGDDRLIIDLTGMQYGWEERIYHVEAYRQYRGETMGSYKFEAVDVERDQLQDYGPNTLPWVIYSFQKALARAIDEALAAFFTAVKVSPDVFLFKSKKVFDKQCVKLIDHVKRTMEAEANDLRVRRGIGRLYLEVTPPKLLVKAVGGVGMQEILNKVWFNHEEVEKTEGNEQALILEWIARCERAVSQ